MSYSYLILLQKLTQNSSFLVANSAPQSVPSTRLGSHFTDQSNRVIRPQSVPARNLEKTLDTVEAARAHLRS